MNAFKNFEASKEAAYFASVELSETKQERIETMLYKIENGGAVRYKQGNTAPFLDLEAAFHSITADGEEGEQDKLAAVVAKSCYDDNTSMKEMLIAEARNLIEEHYNAIIDYEFENDYIAA